MNPATLQTIVIALLGTMGAVGGQVIRLSGKTGRELRAARSLASSLADYIYSCRRTMSANGLKAPEYPTRIATYLDPADEDEDEPVKS